MGDEWEPQGVHFGMIGPDGFVPIGEMADSETFVSEGCGGCDRLPLRDFSGSLDLVAIEHDKLFETFDALAARLAGIPLTSFWITCELTDAIVARMSRPRHIWELRQSHKGHPRNRG